MLTFGNNTGRKRCSDSGSLDELSLQSLGGSSVNTEVDLLGNGSPRNVETLASSFEIGTRKTLEESGRGLSTSGEVSRRSVSLFNANGFTSVGYISSRSDGLSDQTMSTK